MIIAPLPPTDRECIASCSTSKGARGGASLAVRGAEEEGDEEKQERKDVRWNMKSSFGRREERADGIGKCGR